VIVPEVVWVINLFILKLDYEFSLPLFSFNSLFATTANCLLTTNYIVDHVGYSKLHAREWTFNNKLRLVIINGDSFASLETTFPFQFSYVLVLCHLVN